MGAHGAGPLLGVVGLKQHTPLVCPEPVERADDVLEVHMRIFSGCDLVLARPTVEQLPIQGSGDGGMTLVQHWDFGPCLTPAAQAGAQATSPNNSQPRTYLNNTD